MYTHVAYGYLDEGGQLDRRFRELMERIASMNGWFVPVGTLLDYLGGVRGVHTLTDVERQRLEWRWLRGKALHGTS
jgi:hypothetical protein